MTGFIALSAMAGESPAALYDFDIPRTTRMQALHELSQQGGGILAYLPSNTEEEQSLVGPVKGNFTVEGALREILDGSTLTYRWVEPDILAVERTPLKSSEEAAQGLSTAPRPEIGPEEVIVVSWPLRDLTLSVTPTVVLDREKIDALGAPTISEALRYLSQSAYTRPEGYRTSGAQYAEMRGLGPGAALVLINGRRALPSANSITSDAFDLNTIPITAVERVEFTDSAAAAYGTDALDGVINIVLRQQVDEPSVEVRYGATASGAEQRRITLSAGTNSERFVSAMIADYFAQDGLLGSERDLWRNQDYRRFGSEDQRSLVSVGGNIRSVSDANLPGLPAPNAAVPLSDPTPGISRDDFLATAGASNLESLFNYWSIVPESRRISLVGSASYALTDKITAAAEMLYVDRNATFHFYPPGLHGVPVAPSNAYNPFGTTVLADRLLLELGSQYQYVESELIRSAAALHGRWAGWDWGVSAMYSHEAAATWIQNELDATAVLQALASSDPAQALNPFQSGPIGSREQLQSLVAQRAVDAFASIGEQILAYAKGAVFSVPAGPVTASLGSEWRRESGVFKDNDMDSLDRDRDITAAFLQMRVPLVDESMHVPAVQELSFAAGSRLDRYDNMEPVVRSQYGLRWKPHRSLAVRASESRSFRPPSLYELYFPNVYTLARAPDPARRNELASIVVVVGGNSELQPSMAETMSAGFTFAPDTAMNWSFSADYWDIAMGNRVTAIPLSLLLANEASFPDRVTRAAPTEADIRAGLPGALRAVDGSRINVGGVEASGIDFLLRSDFQTSLGRFEPELRVTWIDTFLSADIPEQPLVDRVSLASEFGTILDWRAILSLEWQRGPYAIMTAARYTPSYDDAVAGVRSGRRIGAQTLIDLQGSLDLGRVFGSASAWDGLKLSAGAINLFGAEPSFAEVGGASGFDSSQADLKPTSYYLRIEKAL